MVKAWSVLFLTSGQSNHVNCWDLKFPELSVVTNLLNIGGVQCRWLPIFVVGEGKLRHSRRGHRSVVVSLNVQEKVLEPGLVI